jgi:epoxyqueuosine reductase QueG
MEEFDENKLKQKIIDWGADVVGFADLKNFVSDELASVPNAISIGVRLSDQIIKGIRKGPTMIYAYNYQITNSLLNEIALKTTNYLQKLGFNALPIPASQNPRKAKVLLYHKTAATCAGLGWIGKNALLIHPEFGPRLRLVSVMTDAPITKFGKPITQSKCGKCRSCVKACVVNALKGVNWTRGMDINEYFAINKCQKQIDKNRAVLDRPVCGICISACPVGLTKKVK